MSEINVAFAVDNNNLDQVAVVITSILASSRDPAALRFFVVLDGSAEEAARKIAGWAIKPDHLTLLPNGNAFAGRTHVGHISSAALLRTQLPELLPDLDRVLYLDADLIVRHDIAELYQSDLGGKAMGGIVDLGIYTRLRRETIHGKLRLRDYFRRLGLDMRRSPYVNSGVLVMDLKALRQLRFSAAALAFSSDHGAELITMDQCLTNAILTGKIATLDPRWNACAYMMCESRHHHYLARWLQPNLRLQLSDPWLIHYTGRAKPWNSTETWRGADWWVHARNSGIDWPSPPPSVPRRRSSLTSAWLAITRSVSYALSRVYPD
jgi:lipopolysaccharide biosynthesis glycosyltransferase